MSGPEIALRATQGGLGAPMGVGVGPGATASEIGPQNDAGGITPAEDEGDQ